MCNLAGAMLRLSPGDRIASYRLERELGTSSTAVVYQAVHQVLPRRARLALAARPPFAVQLLREACIIDALRHPGVPQIFETGRLDDGRPWFATELVDGITFAERLAYGPVPMPEAIALLHDLAEILEHAHRRGVIHRGVRPDRVVLSAHRRFGTCIVDWSDARTHDATHAIPRVLPADARAFLAPELARGDVIDDRADVYSLGVLGNLALTGTVPAAPGLFDSRRSLRDASPSAPAEVARLIDQMMALDRYDRPASSEVRAELAWLATTLATSPEAPPIEDIVLVDSDGVPEPVAPRTRRPRWTPPYPGTLGDGQGVVTGEIAGADVRSMPRDGGGTT